MGTSYSKYSVLVAIDFGTAYSGYAYSYFATKEKTHLNPNWGGMVSTQSVKTPTSVFYNNSKGAMSFGYQAEDGYFELIETGGRSNDYKLFRSFKMQLYEDENENSFDEMTHKLKSVEGQEELAMGVFVDALKCLRDDAIRKISQSTGTTPQPKDIRWVVTVPAIWKDKQKMFMREACRKANLIEKRDSPNLQIALEPECASLYCKNLSWDRTEWSNQRNKLDLKTGTVYMTVDLGGGTIDIAVHKVAADNKVTSVISPVGGPHGGNSVNEGFVKLLEEFLGQKFIEDFQKKLPSAWFSLLNSFELKKRMFTESKEVSLEISAGLVRCYNDYFINKSFDKISENESMEVRLGSRLIIKSNAMQKLFNDVTKQIIDKIKTAVNCVNKKDSANVLKYVFLVGGFSDNKYVQDSIIKLKESHLPGAEVLIPEEAGLCVLRGAVAFGHTPDFIKSRVSDRTYVLLTERHFNKIRVPKMELLIKKGEDMPEGLVVHKKIYIPESANSIKASVHYSQSKSISGPNDPTMSHLCDIEVTLYEKERTCDSYFMLNFVFGQTEHHVHLADDSIGYVEVKFGEGLNVLVPPSTTTRKCVIL